MLLMDAYIMTVKILNIFLVVGLTWIKFFEKVYLNLVSTIFHYF